MRSYLLTFAADASLYETSRRLVRQLGRNANVVKFLDAPDPTGMLEAGSVTRFRRRLQNSADAARVRAGRRYLFVMDRLYDLDAKARAAGCPWLWERAQALAARPELSLSLESSTASVGSDLAVLKRGVKRTWFPLQKGVAAWMGEVRLRRPGRYLITPAQQREIAARLEPGDILLSRKNWYLSNVGLPGFWPHAILHVGTPDELTAWADDVEVRAYLRRLTGEETTLGACLARRYPRRWAAYLAGGSGGSIRVIEAIGEGVMLNPLAAASGDYLAVLRPRLPKVAKAQAIIAAFGYLGRPYDFDFDFATDNALVCTELVWRSYRPADGKEGLTIRPVKIAGRRTLPANELARLFADEHGRDDAQLQFVCFFDASEETQSVHVATEADFLDSWRRSKWDIRQP